MTVEEQGLLKRETMISLVNAKLEIWLCSMSLVAANQFKDTS